MQQSRRSILGSRFRAGLDIGVRRQHVRFVPAVSSLQREAGFMSRTLRPSRVKCRITNLIGTPLR